MRTENPIKVKEILEKKLILTKNDPILSNKILKYLTETCDLCKNENWEENHSYCDICNDRKCLNCLQKCVRCKLVVCKDTCREKFCGVCATFLDCWKYEDVVFQEAIYD